MSTVLRMKTAAFLLVLGQTRSASAQVTSGAATARVFELPASAPVVCTLASSVLAEEPGAGCSSLLQGGWATVRQTTELLEVKSSVEHPAAAASHGATHDVAHATSTGSELATTGSAIGDGDAAAADAQPTSLVAAAVVLVAPQQQASPTWSSLKAGLGLLQNVRSKAQAMLLSRAESGVMSTSSLNIMMVGLLCVVAFMVVVGCIPLAIRSMNPSRMRNSGASDLLNEPRQSSQRRSGSAQRPHHGSAGQGAARRPAPGPCTGYTRSPPGGSIGSGGSSAAQADSMAMQAKRYSDALTPAAAQDFPAIFLCPELVVPEGQECTLLVPRLPNGSAAASQASQISVDDLRGVPVFHAYFGRQGRCLTLASAGGDSIFAFCCEDEATRGLTIHHSTEAQFASLRADGGRGYTVATRRGWRVHLRGDIRLGNVNATDDQGHLLALAEPFGQGNSRRSVRIGPQVDAGLIALAILGADYLEQQAVPLF